jgi:hypothetical protein
MPRTCTGSRQSRRGAHEEFRRTNKTLKKMFGFFWWPLRNGQFFMSSSRRHFLTHFLTHSPRSLTSHTHTRSLARSLISWRRVEFFPLHHSLIHLFIHFLNLRSVTLVHSPTHSLTHSLTTTPIYQTHHSFLSYAHGDIALIHGGALTAVETA